MAVYLSKMAATMVGAKDDEKILKLRRLVKSLKSFLVNLLLLPDLLVGDDE